MGQNQSQGMGGQFGNDRWSPKELVWCGLFWAERACGGTFGISDPINRNETLHGIR